MRVQTKCNWERKWECRTNIPYKSILKTDFEVPNRTYLMHLTLFFYYLSLTQLKADEVHKTASKLLWDL